MPKQTGSAEIPAIQLDNPSSVPLHRQLYNWLRQAIFSGQLSPGQRLPSTRNLASQLGISRNTVSNAYDQLVAEGYIEGQVGHGTRVVEIAPQGDSFSHTAASRKSKPGIRNSPEGLGGPILSTVEPPVLLPYANRQGLPRPVAFQGGLPALDQFPYKLWAKIVARCARNSLPAFSNYQNSAGYLPLREAIAAYLGFSRGVRCQADQILIVPGSQAGLALTARIFAKPGDLVWVEDPGYFGAYDALQNAGLQLSPIPVERDGLAVEQAQARFPQARLAVVTPSHQFPMGVTLSLSKRVALLEWARKNQGWIFEDDYDSEFRFSGRPLEALQGLDRAERVIYSGTFSKVLFPALRQGYLVLPPALVDTFVTTARISIGSIPILEQMALADFMLMGHFARHTQRMQRLYQARRDALIAALSDRLGDILEIHVPEAGMHLTAMLPPGLDDALVSQKALEVDLEVMPLSKLSLTPRQQGGLMLGFAAVNEEAIRAGVEQLAGIIHSLLPKSHNHHQIGKP